MKDPASSIVQNLCVETKGENSESILGERVTSILEDCMIKLDVEISNSTCYGETEDDAIICSIIGKFLLLIDEKRQDTNDEKDAMNCIGLVIGLKSGMSAKNLTKFILPFISEDDITAKVTAREIADSFVNFYSENVPGVYKVKKLNNKKEKVA